MFEAYIMLTSEIKIFIKSKFSMLLLYFLYKLNIHE